MDGTIFRLLFFPGGAFGRDRNINIGPRDAVFSPLLRDIFQPAILTFALSRSPVLYVQIGSTGASLWFPFSFLRFSGLTRFMDAVVVPPRPLPATFSLDLCCFPR